MNAIHTSFGFISIEIFDFKNGFMINPMAYTSSHYGRFEKSIFKRLGSVDHMREIEFETF